MPSMSRRTPTSTPAGPVCSDPLDVVYDVSNDHEQALLAGDTDRASATPTWTEEEIRAVQTELKRINLYELRVDGDLGGGSMSGLTEAFGSDRWRVMTGADVLTELQGAAPVDRGADIRYGEMFKDGVIDISLGVGFDEGGNHNAAIDGFQQVLGDRGFTVDPGRAAELYLQAGRTVGECDFGQYFVKNDALSYTPPVGGPARSIHAVVRLVFSRDGSQGGEAAGAFSEGLAESDVAYYSGHGRYGSGPDFDRNFSFDLLDESGAVEQHLDDYTVLERTLAAEGRSAGRGAWAQFLWRERNGRIQVNGSNEGNVFINPDNLHGGEFGSRLMYWNLEQSGGAGAVRQTGEGGALEGALADPEARDYHLMVFDGCRTRDYVQSVRGTPGVDQHNTDILATRRTVNWGDEVRTLATFLDNLIAQSSEADIVAAMDQEQGLDNGGSGGAYRGY
jgi:hypothetical protein